jgi:hypothetical protein
MKKGNPTKTDLTDPARDQQRLKGDQGILDLPELKDIPGKAGTPEAYPVLPGDITVSSADEEGDELLAIEEEEYQISPLENTLLNQAFDPPYDVDLPVNTISLDDRDEEGERLEEAGSAQDLFGEDLDDDLVEEEDEEGENKI